MLQRPRQQPLAELGHLLTFAQYDGVAADKVDAADVRVEVDADHRPVEPGGNLLDVGRLARAVIALDHHPAVLGEAGADGERRARVEHVGGVEVGHALVGFAKSRDLHVRIDAEQVAYPGDLVWGGEQRFGAAFRVHVGNQVVH